MEEYLLVGLGNPGSKYEMTRHNLGFMVIEELSKRQNLPCKRSLRLKGKAAVGEIGERQVVLLMPSTYMNLSGHAVRKAIHYYKIPLERVLIVVDEVYLKLGTMRLRSSGSAGGHNGLKNIEACLNTQEYSRLRIGVGPQNEPLSNGQLGTLEEYVLGNFTASEQKLLPQIVERGASVARCWLDQGIEAASQLAGELSKLGFQ